MNIGSTRNTFNEPKGVTELDDRTRNMISDTMSDKTFSRFGHFIQSRFGIKMPEGKKTMLQARLLKRLRKLGLETFDEYSEYLFSPEGMEGELPNMINVVTTNKTDFFREPGHFDYLKGNVVPELLNAHGTGINREARIWSAGCSTGEEPYTIAMVLSESALNPPGFRFSILGTDISTKVLKTASLAIYPKEKAEPIPDAFKKKYLLKSRNKTENLVRVVPELRSRVRFHFLNFMVDEFGIKQAMDVIFCRNVIIYFERNVQEIVLNRLCRYLKTGGYMFIGHSETLNGLRLPLIPVVPTIYRKV